MFYLYTFNKIQGLERLCTPHYYTCSTSYNLEWTWNYNGGTNWDYLCTSWFPLRFEITFVNVSESKSIISEYLKRATLKQQHIVDPEYRPLLGLCMVNVPAAEIPTL